MIKLRAVLSVALATSALGCSAATEGGSPAPSVLLPSDTYSSATTAPSVSPTRAIDLATADPCSTVSPDVLTTLGYLTINSTAARTGVTKVGCSFLDQTGIYGGGLFFDSGKGISQYSDASGGKVLTPVTIEGFPAFAIQDEQIGACTVAVGVASTEAVAATRSGPQGQPVAQQCDKATALATAAVSALNSK